ncbi:MAG: tetratricopeptide repeat protein [Cyanothece sp. SIO1E1]|nr:tetratricopeptide repeat protein [Cyanothece sp. SIO1E1]
MKRISLQIIISFLLLYSLPSKAQDRAADLQSGAMLREQAKQLQYENPDSALTLLQLSYDKLLEEADTLHLIEVLKDLAQLQGHRAFYHGSYEYLWEALSLADQTQNENEKATIYIHLGRYYSYYKRRDKALDFFERALQINKRLVAEGDLTHADLVFNYVAFAATFRELDEPALARQYLDTCFLYYSPSVPLPHLSHLKFEQAYLERTEREYEAALQTYMDIQDWFETNNPSFKVLLFSYRADVYQEMQQYEKSKSYYQKALEVSKQYKRHEDFTPSLYHKLSVLHLANQEYKKAHENLKEAARLDEAFFGTRSANNQSLFEIQDAFRLEKERNKALQQEQRMVELEHQNKVWFLQMVILLFFLITGGILFLYIRSRFIAEKKMIRKEQELERKTTKERLDLKNKELVVSALKLIEKDKFLSEIKDKLKEKKAVSGIPQIINSISVSQVQNWEEFETRFVAVNQGFYGRLLNKFPDLTDGDQKMCALIKLNFTSKEMAKLMGISVGSVHTSRHRLRKKLNLSREANLSKFISEL